MLPQFLPSTPPYASFGKVVYSANSFCSTDDGFLRSLAFLTHDTNPADYYGAMVLKATYNNGAFYLGQAILYSHRSLQQLWRLRDNARTKNGLE